MITNVANTAELMAALATASGGDTIDLASGNYGSANFDGFTFSDYVTITSADGNRGAKFSHLKVSNSSFLQVDGVEVKRGVYTGRALEVHDSDHIKITNNFVHHTGVGIVGITCTNLTIAENIGDGFGSDMMMFAGVFGFLFENNTHLGNTFQAEGAHMDFIQFAGSGGDGVLRGNIMICLNAANVQGLFFDNGDFNDILMENNVVQTNMARGIMIGTRFGTVSGIVVRNNTILDLPGGSKETGIGLPSGSVTKDNIQSTFAANSSRLGLDSSGGLRIQWDDPSKPHHYDLYLKDAAGGLGTTLEGLRPVPGSLGESKGAFARILEVLDGTPPIPVPVPDPTPDPTPEPDPTPDPTPTPEPTMDELEIISATLDDPAMGSVLIVGTVGVDQRLRVVSDSGWIQNITGTYTVRDLAGQEASTTFIQAVTNPAPVATADTFLVAILAGDTVDLDVLMNDTA